MALHIIIVIIIVYIALHIIIVFIMCIFRIGNLTNNNNSSIHAIG